MKYIVFALALACAGTAHAQRISNITGAKLGDICISKNSASSKPAAPISTASSDAISFYQHLMPSDGTKGKLPDYVCIPGPTTGPQLREAYVTWLRAHNEAQRQPAAQAAMRALNDSFKCAGET